jgi:hypothetical protein
MFDARTFPSSIDKAQKILMQESADFKGEYTIHDIIFSSKDPEQTLDKIFLRLRLVPQNIWNEKPFIVAIKNTDIKEVGKQSIIPLKKQFDTEIDARDFINTNYLDQFEYAYEFDRKGWQYDLGEDQIDLEDIESHFSIEYKSQTENKLKELLKKFNVYSEDVIKGPSVIAIRNILKR